jgi:DNA-directed RNA polymerase sigma subunit (sigma70/sigma32)
VSGESGPAVYDTADYTIPASAVVARLAMADRVRSDSGHTLSPESVDDGTQIYLIQGETVTPLAAVRKDGPDADNQSDAADVKPPAEDREALHELVEGVAASSDAAGGRGDDNDDGTHYPDERTTAFEDPEDSSRADTERMDSISAPEVVGDVEEDVLEDGDTVEVEDILGGMGIEGEAEICEAILAGEEASEILDSADRFYELFVQRRDVSTSEELVGMLERRKRLGEEARMRLAANSLEVARWGARKYGPMLPVDEATGAAYLGLVKAAQKFNPSLGVSFSHYAPPWVRREVVNTTYDMAFAFRLTRNIGEPLFAMWTHRPRLHAQLGREPTDAELAAAIGVKPAVLHEIQAIEARLLSTVELDRTTSASGTHDDSRESMIDVMTGNVASTAPTEEEALRMALNGQVARILEEKVLPALTPLYGETLRLITGIGMPKGFTPLATPTQLAQYYYGDIADSAKARSLSARIRRLYQILREYPELEELFHDMDI